MSKKLPTKTGRKKNYRLRKSVRRTLGALFLISAIIVAAIPFPDAAAADPNAGTTGTNSNQQGAATVSAPAYSPNIDSEVNKDVSLREYQQGDSSFYTLRQIDGGIWRYEKMFDYYTIQTPVQGAILSKYNNLYSVTNLTLPSTINSGEYVHVQNQADFENYFGTTEVSLEYSEINSEKGAKFQYFFPSKYQQLVDGNGAINTTIKATLNEIDSSKRGAYYCENEGITVNGSKQKFSGTVTTSSDGKYTYTPAYTLIQAEKPKAGVDGGVDVIYILQANSQTDAPGGYRKDDNGFVYSVLTNSFDLVGIGKSAFAGVTNGMTLSLPKTLLYVGDRAFENSYVEKITLTNVKDIGNYAFKGSRLQQVDFTTANLRIGTEAFSGTRLTSANFPYSINTIGEGAFANNDLLTTLAFDSTSDLNIKQFAFYNCPNLASLDLAKQKISSIGKGAFALDKVDSGSLTSFKLPDSITTTQSGTITTGLGDYVFYGRTGLKEVTMPSNLGYTNPVTSVLPANLFANCTGLSFVEFPDTSRFTTFPNTLFSTVDNPDFYVKGPKLDGNNEEAGPRKSTWACKMAGDAYVPYVFVEDGNTYYEVSDGNYLLLIDQAGTLLSCKFADSKNQKMVALTIPGKVGNIQVSQIADGCFPAEFLPYIGTLTVEPGGALKVIGNNAFAGATELAKVDLSNSSVESIGDSAFEGCRNLGKEVTIQTDKGPEVVKGGVVIGANVTKIGANAFKDCGGLEEITFEAPAGGAASFPKENIGNDAFATGGAKLTINGILEEGYGPFEFAMDPNTYMDRSMGIRVLYKTPAPTNLSVILDNRNELVTLVDYPQYGDLPEQIRKDYEANNQMTPADEASAKAAVFIEIPAGIESIDAKGYLNNEPYNGVDGPTNSFNKTAYFSGPRFDNYAQYGLFAGNTNDTTGDPANKNETKEIGNDRIRSITMHTVKYLPNSSTSISGDILSDNGLSGGAFYSCENLETVSLGTAMEDVGSLPFLGAYKLGSVASDSPKYVCNNKILYKNLEDGSKEIVEVLGSRGNANDRHMTVENDPDLANVSSMAIGAVSDVPELTMVDFTGNEALREIPDKAFLASKKLSDVVLPTSIRTIGLKSFAENGNIRVSILGREISLATDAFENTVDAIVYAYDDSAAYNTAKKIESLYSNVEVRALNDIFRVQFFDYDGITALTDVQYVERGKNAELPEKDPVRTGYIFKGWNKSHKDIQADTDILALYDVDPSNPGGLGPGAGTGSGGTGGTGGNTGTGSGSGGTNVNGGVDINGDGIPDVDKDGNKLYTLTVTGGNGSGRYKAGQKVSIMATGGSTGSMFGYWSSSNKDVIFDDATKSTSTLIMPASDATVIANYVGQYRLEVKYGSGSGSYAAGTKVAISAVDAPLGKKFYKWTSPTSGLTIESSTSTTTTITMPASNATVEATYSNTGASAGSTGTTGSTGTASNNKTSIIITRPGISDTDQASAYVSGSSDGFIVKITESAEATEAALAALQNEYGDMTPIKFAAMDISLYDSTGTKKITDTTGLKINITMPIPDALRSYAGNNKIAGIVNGSLDKLGVKFITMNGVPCMSFTATHFSPYVVYVDTGNLAAGNVLDSTPQTGDGIHPKWFLSIGLASISMILFLKRDPKYKTKLS